MAKKILIGTTDRTVLVFIPDPASTTGTGKTGLTGASFTVSNTRVETDNDVVVTDYTSSLTTLSALTDAHTDWGMKEVSATLAPGLYRLDLADAVFASGAWYSVVWVGITSGLAAASPIEFQLVAYNELDAVRMGLTALPNAAADAAGGLPISDAGGLDLDAQRTDVSAILTDTGTTLDGKIDSILTDTGTTLDGKIDSILADTAELQTDWANGGRLDLLLDATLADTNELQTDWANGGRLDLIVDAILDDTDLIDDGTSGLAKIATDVAAILVDTGTDIPATLSTIATDTTTDIPATLSTIAGYLDTEIAAIKAKTDNLPSDPADASDVAAAITAAWTTALTESYATDGSAATPAQLLYMLWSAVAEFSISGTTITAKKLDGSTTAMTFTVDSATDPTSRTRAT